MKQIIGLLFYYLHAPRLGVREKGREPKMLDGVCIGRAAYCRGLEFQLQ